jgi:hypothetical protein
MLDTSFYTSLTVPQAQLPTALLFLKNVSKVSVWIKGQHSTMQTTKAKQVAAAVGSFVEESNDDRMQLLFEAQARVAPSSTDPDGERSRSVDDKLHWQRPSLQASVLQRVGSVVAGRLLCEC